MCKTGSISATATDERMSLLYDSHSRLIADAGWRESGPGDRFNVLNGEFIPPHGNWLATPDDWAFVIDEAQKEVPGWWQDDPHGQEQRLRCRFERWLAEKFQVLEGGLWVCNGPLQITTVHECLEALTESGDIDAPSATNFSAPALTESGDIYAGLATNFSAPALTKSGDIDAGSATNFSAPALTESGYIYAGSATNFSAPALTKEKRR
jgi:hypothetical protein